MITLSCYHDNVIMLSWQGYPVIMITCYHIFFSWKLHTLLYIIQCTSTTRNGGGMNSWSAVNCTVYTWSESRNSIVHPWFTVLCAVQSARGKKEKKTADSFLCNVHRFKTRRWSDEQLIYCVLYRGLKVQAALYKCTSTTRRDEQLIYSVTTSPHRHIFCFLESKSLFGQNTVFIGIILLPVPVKCVCVYRLAAGIGTTVCSLLRSVFSLLGGTQSL
jgi:hypothetical protein